MDPEEDRLPDGKPRGGRKQISGTRRTLEILAFVIAATTLLPILYLFVRAVGMGQDAVDLVFRAQTLAIFLRSVGLAGAVTASAVLLGVTLAWLTTSTDLPGRRTWTVAAALPLAVPSFVGAFALISALGPRGLLQQALAPVGVDRLPSIYGFPGAWLALTLYTYPYVFLTVRASFQGMDPSIQDAARTLGKSSWQVFRDITAPHIRPAVRAGGLLAALYTLSDFGAVSLMQYDVFTRAIYLQYIASLNLATAAVLALCLVALTAVIVSLERESPHRRVYYRTGAGEAREPRVTALGAWTFPALLGCGLVVLFGIGLPVLTACIWLVRGMQSGEPLLPGTSLLWNSTTASAAGAFFAILAAMPLVILRVRYPGRWHRGLQKAAYLGHALPGIVIALALVFFSARYFTALYQSLALLVAAYVIRFLPHALGSIRASMLQINPRLDEAGRSLGKSSTAVFGDIIFPLLRPGILMGAAMVFLSCMKELPATLLLSPSGYETLATRIWSATEEAFFARAALPALILIAISAVSVWILLGQEQKGARA